MFLINQCITGVSGAGSRPGGLCMLGSFPPAFLWAARRLGLGLRATSAGSPLPRPGRLIGAQLLQRHLKALWQVVAIPLLAYIP